MGVRPLHLLTGLRPDPLSPAGGLSLRSREGCGGGGAPRPTAWRATDPPFGQISRTLRSLRCRRALVAIRSTRPSAALLTTSAVLA